MMSGSDLILQDDTFARLMTFPNVMITGHQAFFTEDGYAIDCRGEIGKYYANRTRADLRK